MSADEIIRRLERNRSFYKTGGITATGGEPMLQIEFLTELFAKAKERGIHTCLDTSRGDVPRGKRRNTDRRKKRKVPGRK